MQKNKKNKNTNSGFTLLELLVVVVIIGVFAAIVIYALNDARSRGSDAGVKSNLANARTQADLFFNTNTVNPNTYNGVCTNGTVGGVQGIGLNVYTAARSVGLSGYSINGVPNLPGPTVANCNVESNSWAAEVPLKQGGFWCVDSMSRSIKNTSSIGLATSCN